jgi:hypothetical protein
MALPVFAVAVIAMLSTGVVSTLSQFTATIGNTNNTALSGTVNLSENAVCTAPGDGQWHDCTTVNKYGGGTLHAGGTEATTVAIKNAGTVPAHLFLLPSACTGSVNGAGGPVCNELTVTVSCPGVTPPFTLGPVTLNAFAANRNYPTGYSVGTLAAGATTSCSFTLTAAASIPTPGTVSQPIAWRLQA